VFVVTAGITNLIGFHSWTGDFLHKFVCNVPDCSSDGMVLKWEICQSRIGAAHDTHLVVCGGKLLKQRICLA